MNKNKLFAAIAGCVIGGGLSIGLGACSNAQPAISQCAIVTNNGFGASSQHITAIVHPGNKVEIGNNQLAWYYPCDARNFIFSPPGQAGDVHVPVSVRTAPAANEPGMPVNIWLGIYFTPNQNNTAMGDFLPFCLKYGCAESSNQVDSSVATSAHFSSPGWEGMLTENFPFATTRAAQDSIGSFGPSLWTDRSQWPKLGDMIAANLNAELDKETGSSVPFFCGNASSESNCAAMTVVINQITPVDPAVQTIYNQQIAAESALQANAARYKAAQELYGQYAGYFLGVQDTINQCGVKQSCNIYIGNPNTIPTGK